MWEAHSLGLHCMLIALFELHTQTAGVPVLAVSHYDVRMETQSIVKVESLAVEILNTFPK